MFTVRDDTGRMWLEVAQGVFVNELCEVPSETSGFEIKFQPVSDTSSTGVSMPRECCYLFRRGELLGTAPVKMILNQSIVDRFFSNRIVCECHAEVGDDDEPFAVFVSLAHVKLKGQVRFETDRFQAFGWFPIEGI